MDVYTREILYFVDHPCDLCVFLEKAVEAICFRDS